MKLDRRYHCFGCGADGDVIDFAAALYGLGRKEAAVQLAQDFGLSYEAVSYTHLTLFFGVMYMLAEYGTFKMANNIAFNKLNAPDLEMIVAGAIISAIGMLVGSLWNKKRHNQKK